MIQVHYRDIFPAAVRDNCAADGAQLVWDEQATPIRPVGVRRNKGAGDTSQGYFVGKDLGARPKDLAIDVGIGVSTRRQARSMASLSSLLLSRSLGEATCGE